MNLVGSTQDLAGKVRTRRHGEPARSIPRDTPMNLCIQTIPTLGPKVCKYYLHWAVWIPRALTVERSFLSGVGGRLREIFMAPNPSSRCKSMLRDALHVLALKFGNCSCLACLQGAHKSGLKVLKAERLT